MIDKYIRDHVQSSPAMEVDWKALQFAIKQKFIEKPEFARFGISLSYLNHNFPKKNYLPKK